MSDQLELTRELLRRLGYRFIEESDLDAARAMKESDLILLEVQLSRFEQRRDFWQVRSRSSRLKPISLS
jgi:hypothetical protein